MKKPVPPTSDQDDKSSFIYKPFRAFTGTIVIPPDQRGEGRGSDGVIFNVMFKVFVMVSLLYLFYFFSVPYYIDKERERDRNRRRRERRKVVAQGTAHTG